MKNNIKKCCICGDYFDGWGNNPWPVKSTGTVVIPATVSSLYLPASSYIERRKWKSSL